jgi:septum formation protein
VEKNTSLILASASVSRARMLQAAGVRFEVQPSSLDETQAQNQATDGVALARKLATAKALSVSRQFPDALVLGADSVLVLGEEIVSKCADQAQARMLLRHLAGKTHRLVSAAALVQDGQIVWQGMGEGLLAMRSLDEAFLDAYLAAEGDALLACVGCYRLEGRGAQLFDSIKGDYFSILGLPLLPLLAALRERNVPCC